ncbi:shikimate dehydrogenase [Oryzibacter oryziterrae]|uniref:shikimate dehydrogenase n=1 Tax=Oryzibacter oryziterrae TaxID=2766474 RepID=UPI001F027A35|nr:shikimate dehydrogenase [Oryzibacter oryziterrae]
MKHAAVIGWPIAHSRSPLIHGHWLETLGIAGSYDRLALEPERAEAFFRDFAASGLVGANVTIPHKEIAARCAVRHDAIVEKLGVANTLWLEDGVLAATNTDQAGFLANLDAGAPGWDANPEVALVIGAGGATAAVVNGLIERGFSVQVANRTVERAEALALRFGHGTTAHDFAAIPALARQAGLVVNATSLGMKGEGKVPIDFSLCRDTTVVTDIVYVPLVTDFLARASARGLRTVDGLGMLLHQAVPGFERWFGVRPKVTPALRQIIEADL